MHLGTRQFSISDLSSDLYLPIIVADPRSSPSTLIGHRRWKMINTTESHLFGFNARNHLQEGRLGSERREMLTPRRGVYAPSRKRCSYLRFGF
jgi:hypothetical protein